MEQGTGDTPVRVSLRGARDAAIRLRAALEHCDIRTDVIRQIIPASDLTDSYSVRLGTWGVEYVTALADVLEYLHGESCDHTPPPGIDVPAQPRPSATS